MSFQDYKDIIDHIIRIQERFYPEVQEYYKMGEGRVSIFRLEGIGGGTLYLKCENNRIKYAKDTETPFHIFTCTPDTFLNIWLGIETMRQAITMNHFMIEATSTGDVDAVEVQKWSRAFETSRGVIRKYFGIK